MTNDRTGKDETVRNKVSRAKARERGDAAKDMEMDFSDDDSGTDQGDRTEIGFVMCGRVETEENNGEQEECNGVLVIKWNEKHCTTKCRISKEDMDK